MHLQLFKIEAKMAKLELSWHIHSRDSQLKSKWIVFVNTYFLRGWVFLHPIEKGIEG